MTSIFLSYSRKDSDIAKLLVNELKDAGYKIWFDRDDVDVGDHWRTEIVEGIKKADFFLLLLSSQSTKSDNVRRELEIASDADRVIIPLSRGNPTIPNTMQYVLTGLQRLSLEGAWRSKLFPLLGSKPSQSPATESGHENSEPSDSRLASKLVLMCMFAVVFGAIAVSVMAARGLEGVSIVSALTAYAGLCAMVFTAFHKTESLLRPEVIHDLGDMMFSTSHRKSVSAWGETFISSFDALFKVRKSKLGLMMPAALRSVLASLASVVVLFLIYLGIGDAMDWDVETDLSSWVMVLTLALVFNCFPDYVSLLESRFVISKMGANSGPFGAPTLLILDALFTVIVAILGSMLANLLFPLVSFITELSRGDFDVRILTKWDIPYDVDALVEIYKALLFIDPTPLRESGSDSQYIALCGVYIYSTFLSSIWVWLFTFSGIFVRLLAKISPLKDALFGAFQVNEQPLKVLGWVTIAVLSVTYWGVYSLVPVV